MSPHFHPGRRIVHKLYGRGVFNSRDARSSQPQGLATFDGEPCPRRVLMRDLELEPANMPAPVADMPTARLIWDRNGPTAAASVPA